MPAKPVRTESPFLQRAPGKVGLYDPALEHDACGVGFVAQIKGQRSHQIILDGQQMLCHMDHRGACGAEPNTGDGAGILTALPHEFLAKVAKAELGADLPDPGAFAAGLIFLPTDEEERERCKQETEKIVAEQGQRLVGWRRVPVEPEKADLGATSRAAAPAIEQLFIAAEGVAGDAFERQLYIIRKRASSLLREDSSLVQAKMFYICSLSSKVIVYKGMLSSGQLFSFFPDLRDPSYTSHLAMVHSRFSTNTFPSWDRAQPNRFMSHNGEINTLRGNVNSMHARQGVVSSSLFSDQLSEVFPVVEPDCSDSGTFDNALEFLLMTGRTLQEAVMMMIPEAWQNHDSLSDERKAFYEYHSCLMEPWDGPASIAFTDGHYIGAVLDRNGLRPSRYVLTNDDRVIMASEVGVLRVDPETVVHKGRLQPGRMFLVDFSEGRIVDDDELKDDFCRRRPYRQWLDRERIQLRELPPSSPPHPYAEEDLLSRQQALGYTIETLDFMLRAIVDEKRDPVGSMGNDAALAILSDRPRMIYDYFKQLFAQVTNPAIDSIREELIMSLACYIGPENNLLETTAEHARRLLVPDPILSDQDLAALESLDYRGWKSRKIDITWPLAEGEAGMERALTRVCDEAETAIDEGYQLIILSDRALGPERVALSSLLACGAVHHHLVRQIKRTRIGIVLESGEAREVHHHCLLVGYGADAINPYLAFQTLFKELREGRLAADTTSDEDVVAAYRKGVAKGMLKVMAKMGISTLHSYKGAQIFEAVGLRDDVIERCFTGTASRIQGAGLGVVAKEALRRHAIGYPLEGQLRLTGLPNPGLFHWRPSGEKHMWSPAAIASIQTAARSNSPEAYERFASLVNEGSTRDCALRGLLRFKDRSAQSVPLDEVEPASEIVKRFCTGAMSFGSISAESHEALAIAMNRIGGKSNTGEGGEDSSRFGRLANGDTKRSAIKQVASGRFGVTAWYLTNADELQIKIAQGAKPGEGGELPGYKVDDFIAKTRYSTPGVGLISPPPHHDIYSIEDLKQLIHDLKNANPEARVSVKLVSEVGVGTIAAGVAKAHSDHILISGHDGGTGASPLTSIKHAGLPWELGIAETHQTLVLNDLRSRVTLQTDGQLKTGRDVVIATLLGAEEYGFATAPLITMGCIMMRKCHLNTCPVGIATQDPELRKKFTGKPEHVVNYLFLVAEDARRIMAELGFCTINEMVGHSETLEIDDAVRHWKSDGLDLTDLLVPATKKTDKTEVYATRKQNHGLENALDNRLIELARPALEKAEAVAIELPILNTNRTVGTMLSHELMKAQGEGGLADDTIHINLDGSAGQSFGAFLAKGITLELEGDANDYVGKGLSGGRLVVYPPKASVFVAEENILVGNVVLYGATAGEAYFRGQAAERFCVRNSGALTVIEGVGDHACEYMTGGRAVILGSTGRNLAAGMSGGIAWVWDRDKCLSGNLNREMVVLEAVTECYIDELRGLIEKHRFYTGSSVATKLLERWPEALTEFVQVMPVDYKRVLERDKEAA